MQALLKSLKPNQPGTVQIIIKSEDDYPVIGALIEPQDEIETQILCKQMTRKSSKGKAYRMNAIVQVKKIDIQSDAILVSGFHNLHGRRQETKVWLIDGIKFQLTKKSWKPEQIAAFKRLHAQENFNSNQAVQEEFAKQGRAMTEIQQLLVSNNELLIFGECPIFCSLENGAIKTLMITETVLMKQETERQKQLRNSGKVNGGDVFVVKKGSPYYNEISKFGGIVGILKYPFNPDYCI